uniref:Reverse transcriptase domain-containing protein n=1 Tax=Rhodnius prolixus TaxID=13249 RepID=T1HCB9_RHOPR
MVVQGTSFTPIYPILAGSILAPLLYTIYTADLTLHPNTATFTFADDTAILSSDPVMATRHLQSHLNILEPWLLVLSFEFFVNKERFVIIQVDRGKESHSDKWRQKIKLANGSGLWEVAFAQADLAPPAKA